MNEHLINTKEWIILCIREYPSDSHLPTQKLINLIYPQVYRNTMVQKWAKNSNQLPPKKNPTSAVQGLVDVNMVYAS